MPIVRLSGTVLGADDPGRSTRAKLLFLLFQAGWDIYNSNGDQRISLSNIEEKIIESDAFVFTPGATIEDMFKAISVFVGYQTLDRFLAGKPTIILNSDQSWNSLYKVLIHLEKMGTIKQDHSEFMLNAEAPEDVIRLLDQARDQGIPDADREKICAATIPTANTPPPSDYRGNVCVFCSATLEDPAFIADGEALGRLLAENRLGCVSGAGKSGIMGAVVRGSVGAGGWTAGSNVPHIIELEGLPDGLSQFWLREDIYTRMEVMIEHSNAFVIFPGGAGTIQELLALMIFKHRDHPVMKNKPVVIFNRPGPDGNGFWDPLIGLLEDQCKSDDFVVATSLEEIIPAVTRHLEPA
ncbi:LOG family protein [Haloferula sp.]|uniref:LOG family protein n=1 Tax=Haloferula sp. TaxID=2497595 RepID=UPI003C754637